MEVVADTTTYLSPGGRLSSRPERVITKRKLRSQPSSMMTTINSQRIRNKAKVGFNPTGEEGTFLPNRGHNNAYPTRATYHTTNTTNAANTTVLQTDTAQALFVDGMLSVGDRVTTDALTYYFHSNVPWQFEVGSKYGRKNDVFRHVRLQSRVKLIIPNQVLQGATVISNKEPGRYEGNVMVNYGKPILTRFKRRNRLGFTVLMPPFQATVQRLRSQPFDSVNLTVDKNGNDIIHYSPFEYVLKFDHFTSMKKGKLLNIQAKHRPPEPNKVPDWLPSGILSPKKNLRDNQHWRQHAITYQYSRTGKRSE